MTTGERGERRGEEKDKVCVSTVSANLTSLGSPVAMGVGAWETGRRRLVKSVGRLKRERVEDSRSRRRLVTVA